MTGVDMKFLCTKELKFIDEFKECDEKCIIKCTNYEYEKEYRERKSIELKGGQNEK